MERNQYFQVSKYIVVSSLGAFFVSAIIANLLGSPFEAAIVFNWIIAAHLLSCDKTNTYHYIFLAAFALLLGGFVFAAALAPLWLFTKGAAMFSGSTVGLNDLHPYYILILNALLSSAYMLRGFRKLGKDPARDFM